MSRRSTSRLAGSVSAARPTKGPGVTFDCEADILVGLEHIVQTELAKRLGADVRYAESSRIDMLRFTYSGDLHALLDLRSVIAIYLARQFAVPRPRALLGHQHFETLVNLIEIVRDLSPSNAYQTLRLSAAGEESSVLSRLKTELAQRTGLTISPDEGDLLLRLRRAALREGWEVLVRLTPRPLATRPWRVCNMPGAPNATLAYSMMYLTNPSAEDRVLNLACGSGTLLIERLALGPAQHIIGCDIDPAALSCARANLRAAGYDRAVRLEAWDAAQLPIDDSSMDVICADLPFGQLIGSHRTNEVLYPRILAEATRVAMPRARMVLLTHEVRMLERVAEEYRAQWRIENVIRVRSGGMTPRIFHFRRK